MIALPDQLIVHAEDPHHLAAEALFQRGFDAAVFGHTHHPEVRELDGGTFVNGGDWLHHRSFVRIEAGELTLGEWEPGALLAGVGQG